MSESRRHVRRFFNTQSKLANALVYFLVGLIYVVFIGTVLRYRSAVEPDAIIIFQLLVLIFLIPSLLHGAIAAEREKRTWDMLMVAPIANSQVVIGKLAGAIVVVGFLVALILPLIVLTAVFTGATFALVMRQEVVTLSFAVLVAALSVYVSARAKRRVAAQLSIFAILFFFLVMYPAATSMVQIGGPDYRQSFELLNCLHPFVSMATASSLARNIGSSSIPLGNFTGVVEPLIYLALSALLLKLTIRHLSKERRD